MKKPSQILPYCIIKLKKDSIVNIPGCIWRYYQQPRAQTTQQPTATNKAFLHGSAKYAEHPRILQLNMAMKTIKELRESNMRCEAQLVRHQTPDLGSLGSIPAAVIVTLSTLTIYLKIYNNFLIKILENKFGSIGFLNHLSHFYRLPLILIRLSKPSVQFITYNFSNRTIHNRIYNMNLLQGSPYGQTFLLSPVFSLL